VRLSVSLGRRTRRPLVRQDAVRTACFCLAVLDLEQRVLYDQPPAGGLDPDECETHECFLVERLLMFGERGVAIPVPGGPCFFEDVDIARGFAHRWLSRVEGSSATGGRAYIRHGAALIDPRTRRPTSQLAATTPPILDTLETGCALEELAVAW
jgi:hypothetical protein